ncbi:MAG: DctP family TRAP transporter solute-binding subunit [Oscillibacter sp.]|jgi:C4-dicarboxylate transporter DctM subunit|nr:DctP family TRAP transporter solute-binding subunit [Oscillibacter sp.]
MKKFLALALALVMTTALLAGCGSSSSTPAASGAASASGSGTTSYEAQTWKFACSATETSTWVEAAKKFGDLIGEATNGAITIEYYPADQLTSGSQTDGIQAVMDGTTEISMHSNLIYSSFDPRFNVVSLPFLFGSTDDADAKLDGDGGAALQDVLAEYGLHCMGIGENGFRHPTNSKHEIASVADMKGLKMRVAGSALLNREYELWGADYANANWSEVFTALQTGTYDGQENPLPTADAASIQEVQKYVTYWTGTYDCLFFCMNKDLYDSLPADLQAIVDDCGQQAVEYQRQINRDQDQQILDKWKSAGVTVTELADDAVQGFKDASAPCYDEFSDELTPDLISAFTGK